MRMTIAIVVAIALIVGIGAFVFLRGGPPRALTDDDLLALEKRSAPEIASVVKCRKAIVELTKDEDAPLRKLVDAGVAKVHEKVIELDEIRARVSRNERRAGILKTSTDQTAAVSGQAGLAASDVSAHQLEAELVKERAVVEALETELKGIGAAAAAIATAAENMPKDGKPSKDHVEALSSAADEFAEKIGRA